LSMRPRLTVICPVFNEEASLPVLFERVAAVLDGIADRYAGEILFINNGSSDRSLELMRAFAARRPGVYAATLSRNMGYQRAVECGLRTAKADLLMVLDADCEDPPEMLRDFLAAHEKGYDVVYGERVDRPEGALLKGLRHLFYRVARALGDDEVVLDMAEFALITAEVRDAIVADGNSFPFLRASIGRVGFRRLGLPYRRQARVAGETHYNLITMTKFAVAGILSSTTMFLRLPMYLLPFWLLAVAACGASWLASGSREAALALLVLVCGYFGATAAFIAVYVARIYKNTLGRPNYVIDRRLSWLP
jgi:polyisoprenyl-phosphate glycosyltransferase